MLICVPLWFHFTFSACRAACSAAFKGSRHARRLRRNETPLVAPVRPRSGGPGHVLPAGAIERTAASEARILAFAPADALGLGLKFDEKAVAACGVRCYQYLYR